jgi:putative methyltransferase (TIGR04325 family)
LASQIKNTIKRFLLGTGNHFAGHYANWEKAVTAASGYDKSAIFEKVKASALRVKTGEAAYERDSIVFDKIQYSWPVLSGLMLSAATNQGRLSVLDFGGSLGTSYFQNRKFLRQLQDVKWGIVEQAHFVACGKEQFLNEELRFYETVAACEKEQKPNVILLGSTLQYLREPQETLKELTATSATLMIIDKTPFSESETNKITVQQVPASIYKASYPMWVLSKSRFMDEMEQHWELVEEFENEEGWAKVYKGIRFCFQGMIFMKR